MTPNRTTCIRWLPFLLSLTFSVVESFLFLGVIFPFLSSLSVTFYNIMKQKVSMQSHYILAMTEKTFQQLYRLKCKMENNLELDRPV